MKGMHGSAAARFDGDRAQGPPVQPQRAATAIPGARLVILPGVGHALPRAIWPTIAQEMRSLVDGSA
jgi:pimeloyl-ACP methyl ester carboxylesterase